MNKRLFSTVIALLLILAVIQANTGRANASPAETALSSVANPGTIIPIAPGGVAKYTQGPHTQGYYAGFITNPGKVLSSIDLGYNGTVVAPLGGKIMIAKNCGDHQIVFFMGTRGSDGNGWAIGLIHIQVATGIKDGAIVNQGQVIGKTVKPLAFPGKGCGYGNGMHIHYTLMKWKMGTKGPIFTEQSIVNTYLGRWIVKNTYLDGPDHDIQLGGLIK